MKKNNKTGDKVLFILLVILSIAFLIPIFFILLNSFKGKLYISDAPFALPTSETFSGLTNYINGIKKTNFLSAFGCSLFITLGSVGMILLLKFETLKSGMCIDWVRVKRSERLGKMKDLRTQQVFSMLWILNSVELKINHLKISQKSPDVDECEMRKEFEKNR